MEGHKKGGLAGYLGYHLGILAGVGATVYLGYTASELLLNYLSLEKTDFVSYPVKVIGGMGGFWAGVKIWPVTSSLGSLVGSGLEKIIGAFYR